MIERQTIDGRAATVAYLYDGFEPADKRDFDLVKIIFDDGQTVFASPDEPDEPTLDTTL
jgi:hypothetical protein